MASLSSAPLGGLHCQRDSYARSCTSTVVKCSLAPAKVSKKFPDAKDLYMIVLDDTVLFPEGGGQPNDLGFIDEHEVVDVQRVTNECVHFIRQELPIGKQVKVSVNWDVRFDHMQHHSGQHLLSAVIVRQLGFETTSWNLGETICHVELDTQKITQEDVNQVELQVNQEIRARRPVTVKEWSKDQGDGNERVTVSPEEAVASGPIRLVEIEGVDACTCCGTHVSNTGDLQLIKLLHTEKTRGNTRLFFVVGNRFLQLSQRMLENERLLTQLLNIGPSGHVESVDRVQKQFQAARRTLKANTEEICELLAQNLVIEKKKSKALFFHREEGDLDFIAALVKVLTEKHGEQRLIFISGGDSKKGEGQFMMVGPSDKVDALGPQVAKLLNAKGGGKKGRYQAKATGLTEAALNDVKKLVLEEN